MRIKFVYALLAGVAFASTAAAATRISGTDQCKADPPTPVAIPDRPNHAYAIIKGHCTWPTPIKIAGTDAKDGEQTIMSEISGNTASDHGYYVGTMSNGDTFTAKFNGTSHSKDGKPVGGEGTWSFTNGTGKLKGLKGGGKYKGSANEDGTMTTQIDGDYSLPGDR